jgi:hypothetical protein
MATAADPDLVRRALDRLARQSRDRTARTLAICTLACLAEPVEPVEPKSFEAVRHLAEADPSASVRLAAARGLLYLSDPRNRSGTPDMFSLLFAADAFPDEPPAKVPWTPDPKKP